MIDSTSKIAIQLLYGLLYTFLNHLTYICLMVPPFVANGLVPTFDKLPWNITLQTRKIKTKVRKKPEIIP